jgi:uncharacterized protein DUF3611
MSQKPHDAIDDLEAGRLSRTFSRLGWIGFWIQVVLGSLPILIMVYYFAFAGAGAVSRSGFPFIEYLAALNLLAILFTICWSFRYTRLARRIANAERRPSQTYVTRTVWTGVIASMVSMFISAVVILVESANLTFYFLKAPQAGIPVIQTSGTDSVRFVSSVDMVSLLALILTLFAQQFVMMCNLWLLHRTTPGAGHGDSTSAAPTDPTAPAR